MPLSRQTRNVHQDEAWESLPDYSFVQEAAEPGWLRIHSVMSDVLRRQLASEAKEFTPRPQGLASPLAIPLAA